VDVILRSLSGDGLARESAAVASLVGGALAHERPAARPLLAGEDVAQERSALPEAALPSSPEVPVARRIPLGDDVMIAVDPDKASNTAAVLDPVTKTLIEIARFASSDEGSGQLARLAGGGKTAAGRWEAATVSAGHWPSGW
jgi:hypothetical protein